MTWQHAYLSADKTQKREKEEQSHAHTLTVTWQSCLLTFLLKTCKQEDDMAVMLTYLSAENMQTGR